MSQIVKNTKKRDRFHDPGNITFDAILYCKAIKMAPALGLPSLRSRTSLARRRTTSGRGLVIFYKIKKTGLFSQSRESCVCHHFY